MARASTKKTQKTKAAAKPKAKAAVGRTSRPTTKPRVTAAAKSVTKPARRGPSVRSPVPAPASAALDASPMRWIDTLRDGTHVIIRAIGKKDAELERAFIENLSPESRRMRFLGQIGKPSQEMLRRLTDLDYQRDMGFIGLVHRDGKTQEIGVSRYSASTDGKFCECAITVADEWHNKGLATLLMHHLIDVARTRGIRTMVSYDAVDNGPMRELAAYLGFKRQSDPDDRGMVIHSLTL